jgi:hypothetical protein
LMREREVPRSPGICPGNMIDLAICFEHECSGVSFPHRGLRKCKSVEMNSSCRAWRSGAVLERR